MPSNDVPDVSVEPLARRSYVRSDRGCRRGHRGILTASWKAQGGGQRRGGCGGNGVHKRRNGENGGETRRSADRAPACGLARRPKAGDWVERGGGRKRAGRLPAATRRSPLSQAATARREAHKACDAPNLATSPS
jgi:hypothetical protein